MATYTTTSCQHFEFNFILCLCLTSLFYMMIPVKLQQEPLSSHSLELARIF